MKRFCKGLKNSKLIKLNLKKAISLAGPNQITIPTLKKKFFLSRRMNRKVIWTLSKSKIQTQTQILGVKTPIRDVINIRTSMTMMEVIITATRDTIKMTDKVVSTQM